MLQGKFIYNSHNADTLRNHLTGQEVEVIRPLTEEEADIEEVGMMYKCKFADGLVREVFEDELDPIKEAAVESHREATAETNLNLSKGQEYMRNLIGKMIFEREECVGVEDFLLELARTYSDESDENKLAVRIALFGENSL